MNWNSIQEINSRKKLFPYVHKNNFPRNLQILWVVVIRKKLLPAKFFLHFLPKNFLTAQTMKECTIPVYFHKRTTMAIVSEHQLKKLDPPIL